MSKSVALLSAFSFSGILTQIPSHQGDTHGPPVGGFTGHSTLSLSHRFLFFTPTYRQSAGEPSQPQSEIRAWDEAPPQFPPALRGGRRRPVKRVKKKAVPKKGAKRATSPRSGVPYAAPLRLVDDMPSSRRRSPRRAASTNEADQQPHGTTAPMQEPGTTDEGMHGTNHDAEAPRPQPRPPAAQFAGRRTPRYPERYQAGMRPSDALVWQPRSPRSPRSKGAPDVAVIQREAQWDARHQLCPGMVNDRLAKGVRKYFGEYARAPPEKPTSTERNRSYSPRPTAAEVAVTLASTRLGGGRSTSPRPSTRQGATSKASHRQHQASPSPIATANADAEPEGQESTRERPVVPPLDLKPLQQEEPSQQAQSRGSTGGRPSHATGSTAGGEGNVTQSARPLYSPVRPSQAEAGSQSARDGQPTSRQSQCMQQLQVLLEQKEAQWDGRFHVRDAFPIPYHPIPAPTSIT